MSIKKNIPACILLFFLYSCKHADLNYVKTNLWQWDSGYKIGDGDFIEFDTSNYYRLSHDTIIREGIPKCTVTWTDAKSYEMKVRSFNGEYGLYINTEEFSR